MSTRTARLFAWLQDAAFYRDLHIAAANLIANSEKKTWLDVGCGPGLLTRIAAGKGYRAQGVDRDAEMIAAARRIAGSRNSRAGFAVSDIETAIKTGERFDVVSASSLLVVLPDPAASLRHLASLTKPGGVVLVIEAGPAMSRLRALALVASGRLGARAYMLLLWASVRSGHALPDSTFDQTGLRTSRHPLLSGLVNAWMVEKIA